MLVQYIQALLASVRRHDDEGATAVEYGLMVALIAVVIIGAVILLGDNLSNMFGGVADSVKAPAGP
ncbi:Flp family type IVb pilin [Krasilnikovia sp. MM14-A1004]|uniref:Flp family type IVb pilin n=1 Tax=Krasilnikovia sp. MM14-A1004 TaxID=3373541 RepID=UPI00399CA7AA